ncbi:helix-turn-helix domain-containing protein [Streptomyces shenzhenensis]
MSARRCPGGTTAGRTGGGPAVHGWTEDRRWTLAGVAELIHGLFGYRCAPRGVSCLLHRLGRCSRSPRTGLSSAMNGRWPGGGRSSGHG